MADNFFMTSSHQPNLEDVYDNQKMMSIVQNNHQKKGQNWEILGTKLHCFGCRARQKYGRTFHTFHDKEKAKLLLKNIARRARIQLNILRSSYLDHRNKRKSSSNNKNKIKSIRLHYPAVLVSAIKVPEPIFVGWRVTDIEPILSPSSLPEVISLISCNPRNNKTSYLFVSSLDDHFMPTYRSTYLLSYPITSEPTYK